MLMRFGINFQKFTNRPFIAGDETIGKVKFNVYDEHKTYGEPFTPNNITAVSG